MVNAGAEGRVTLAGPAVTGEVGDARNNSDVDGKFTGNGFGFIFGLGFDIRVARNFSLTPIANLYYGGIGELSQGGSSTSGLGWKQSVIEIGLDFMFH